MYFIFAESVPIFGITSRGKNVQKDKEVILVAHHYESFSNKGRITKLEVGHWIVGYEVLNGHRYVTGYIEYDAFKNEKRLCPFVIGEKEHIKIRIVPERGQLYAQLYSPIMAKDRLEDIFFMRSETFQDTFPQTLEVHIQENNLVLIKDTLNPTIPHNPMISSSSCKKTNY